MHFFSLNSGVLEGMKPFHPFLHLWSFTGKMFLSFFILTKKDLSFFCSSLYVLIFPNIEITFKLECGLIFFSEAAVLAAQNKIQIHGWAPHWVRVIFTALLSHWLTSLQGLGKAGMINSILQTHIFNCYINILKGLI